MPIQVNSTKYQNMLPYILPISGCFAELLRAASIIFTKTFAEIGGIGKSGLLADLYDLLVGGTKKLFGFLQTKFPDKMSRAFPCLLLKYVTHIPR